MQFTDYLLYPTKQDFPEHGNPEILYHDEAAGKDYIWEEENEQYQKYAGDRPPYPPHHP